MFLGSLLVSAAHYGAYVMGTDLDYKIIHGIGKDFKYKLIPRALNMVKKIFVN